MKCSTGMDLSFMLQQHLHKGLYSGVKRTMNHRGGKEEHLKCRKRSKSERILLECINGGYQKNRSARQCGPVLEHMLYDFEIMLLQEMHSL